MMRPNANRPDKAGVTAAPPGLLRRKCACAARSTDRDECTQCTGKGAVLQRSGGRAREPQRVPEIVNDVLRASAAPLDGATRRSMEARFGHDFSAVRVHTDARAAASARAVDATAYTAGNDIVFDTGRYAPRSPAGRRLLAHELTHVVQQGGSAVPIRAVGPSDDGAEREAERVATSVVDGPVAPGTDARGVPAAHAIGAGGPPAAGLIQRTPAAPAYGGVTGVRDLGRMTIDAVADFLVGGLTTTKNVAVHVSDPSVTHISWEFYDPNDAFLGGFSTLPGSAKATAATFALEPALFPLKSFVAGRHVLRCIGRNAKHEPVVYADRDFNVLKSDLSTNTALPTTYGDLTFTQYDKTDAKPPANPNYAINVKLRFLPGAKVACDDAVFLQSMRTIDDQGRSQQNTVNSEQDARKTPLAWSIDQLSGVPSPYYLVNLNAAKKPFDDPSVGTRGKGGASAVPATLIDTPSWNKPNNAQFESCVVCRSGPNIGQVYGCATWGYTATSAGKVTLMPRGFRQMPSDSFTEATASYNTWRGGIAAAKRPDAVPALRSP